MDDICHVSTPLGPVTLAADGEGLVGLWFDGQAHDRAGLTREYGEKTLPVFEETIRWLTCYFGGQAPDFCPPLHPRGTPFQQKVWARLRQIPWGQTVCYGELARELGCPGARAIGGAAGRNPISLLIPCHRVLGAGGRLTGYAGGLERKQWLLRLEGIEP